MQCLLGAVDWPVLMQCLLGAVAWSYHWICHPPLLGEWHPSQCGISGSTNTSLCPHLHTGQALIFIWLEKASCAPRCNGWIRNLVEGRGADWFISAWPHPWRAEDQRWGLPQLGCLLKKKEWDWLGKRSREDNRKPQRCQDSLKLLGLCRPEHFHVMDQLDLSIHACMHPSSTCPPNHLSIYSPSSIQAHNWRQSFLGG